MNSISTNVAETKEAEQSILREELHQPAAEDVVDPNIVDFDGPDDPANPLNWRPRYKWTMVAILSMMNLMVNLGTIIVAPAAPQILADFHESSGLYSTILVSIWELGEILGPLIIAPLAELYGKLIIYHIANILFIIFSIGGATSTNINMLIAFRCLSGLMVASTTLNDGTVGDMFAPEERGGAISLMGLCPLLGIIIGPIIGGYLTAAAGWRWTFWIITIATGLVQVGFLFLRETYKVTILERKTNRLRKETGNTALRSKYASDLSKGELFRVAALRPARMLLLSPTVAIMSLYAAVIYGWLYLVMTTLTEVFESQFRVSQGPVGLTFIGIGIGMFLGAICCQMTLDKWAIRAAAGGEIKPEYRLPVMVLGGIVLPLGFFIYGWTAERHIHYVVPIIGTAVISFGLVLTTLPCVTYLVDAYTQHAASAMAAMIVLRNVAGTVLPLAGPPLYGKLGLGWGNSVLGFIALAFVPLPLLLVKFGERIRMSKRFEMKL
ncbi:benomyl methotrexate resistance protein [Rutstroemia sp. NJR-2017a BBW]|nr:benomyl methotrexate resistance protein [Rutstroemia sp. NJR-2017a BBW]